MSKKITEIPFWSYFVDCFPDKIEIYNQQDETLITDEDWWVIARFYRTLLLVASDWSQVSDNSLTENQREAWRQYRQDLRDITDTVSNPKNIVFPNEPS
jgi:hypothetical protein